MLDPLSSESFTDLEAQGIADADRGLRVRFFYDEIPDPKRTEVEARPMFRSVEMCEIRIPGDKDNVIVGRVEKMDPDPRRRFAAKYRDWKAGNDSKHIDGTPLRVWGIITPAEAKSYEAIDVYTVEQLAGMSDATCQQHRGVLPDRQKARDFLATAKGLAPASQARAENAALRSEIDALREQIASLGGKVQDPPAPSAVPPDAPKRRGRPPKASPEA